VLFSVFMIQIDVVSPIHLKTYFIILKVDVLLIIAVNICEKEREREKRKREIKHLHKLLIIFILFSDLKKLISFN